jgi:nicotinate-nucleotide adenylyltransferase
MERLYLYLDKDTLKARQAQSYEAFNNPMVWKDLQFEYTTSSFMMISWPILLPELEPETARSLLDLVGSRYPFSAQYEKLKAVCPELVFSQETDEWVFFGGSFNPWHKGHQACLDLLPKDKICFILPDRNPLKELNALEPVSKIIELVTKVKFGLNHFMVPTFLLDFQKNPTISWIEKLHDKFPEKKLSLLMGFDSLKGIQQWVRYEELLKKLNTIYVVSRLEDDQEQIELEKFIKTSAPDIKIIFLGHHEFEALSSTNFRRNNTKA